MAAKPKKPDFTTIFNERLHGVLKTFGYSSLDATQNALDAIPAMEGLDQIEDPTVLLKIVTKTLVYKGQEKIQEAALKIAEIMMFEDLLKDEEEIVGLLRIALNIYDDGLYPGVYKLMQTAIENGYLTSADKIDYIITARPEHRTDAFHDAHEKFSSFISAWRMDELGHICDVNPALEID